MIPDLPATYVDHLVRPRRYGEIPDAHGAGEAGSMVGGLGVRITVTWRTREGRGVLDRCAGRAFGSNAPVALLSWLLEAAVGTTADEALSHDAEAVLAGACEGRADVVPARVHQAAVVVVDALRGALGAADAGKPADPAGRGLLVCRCLGVGDREIRAAIRAGAHDPDAIGEATRACTGCRSCRTDLLVLIDEELHGPVTPPADDDPVVQIAIARGTPLLRALGFGLAGARLDDGTLTVRLHPERARPDTTPLGACAILRHLLRETAWEDARVEPA